MLTFAIIPQQVPDWEENTIGDLAGQMGGLQRDCKSLSTISRIVAMIRAEPLTYKRHRYHPRTGRETKLCSAERHNRLLRPAKPHQKRE